MRPPAPKLRFGRYVALMRIEGVIIDGRSGRLPVQPPVEVPLVGEERAGDLSVVQVARQVAADKRAAAVVLFVNSRGGSSTASEAMRHALRVVAARKPLVVVMGAVAGSGGYDVATPGSWIVAQGKVWTGRQALGHRLVDELGGLEAGIKKARELAGLTVTAPAREVRGPRRWMPPLVEPVAPAGGWFGYVLEGLSILNRAPAL